MATQIKGKQIASGAIANANVAADAAIAQSKLDLAITNSEVSNSAAIAQSKLALSITNSEVNASAAIAQSKLALSITNSEVNASAAIAQSKLALAITNSEVDANAAIAHSKLAISAGTGVALSGSGELSIGQAVATTSDVTFNNVTISGDLSMVGDINQHNVNTLDVADTTVRLNAGMTGNPTLDASIQVERGNQDDVFIKFDETNDKWQFSQYDGNDWQLSNFISMAEFSGGAGITFSDGDISISNDGVTSAMVADGAINDSAMLADGVVNAAKLATDSVLAAKVKFKEQVESGPASPNNTTRTVTFTGLASTQSNGIPAAEKCFVFLNGVALSAASQQSDIGSQGDFFLSDSGNNKQIELDHDLLTDDTDQIMIKYIAVS